MGGVITGESRLVRDFAAKFESRFSVDFRELAQDPLFKALETCSKLDLTEVSPCVAVLIMRMASVSDSIKELSLNFSYLGQDKIFVTKIVASMSHLQVLEGVVIHEQNAQFDGEVLAELYKSNSIIQIIPDVTYNRIRGDSDISPIYTGLISKNTYSLVQSVSEAIEKDGCLNSDMIYALRNSVMEVLEESLNKIGCLGEDLTNFLNFIFFGNICDFEELADPVMENKVVKKTGQKVQKFATMPTIEEEPEKEFATLKLAGEDTDSQDYMLFETFV
jgi:hypothetical protein